MCCTVCYFYELTTIALIMSNRQASRSSCLIWLIFITDKECRFDDVVNMCEHFQIIAR